MFPTLYSEDEDKIIQGKLWFPSNQLFPGARDKK